MRKVQKWYYLPGISVIKQFLHNISMKLLPAVAARTFKTLGHLKEYSRIYREVKKKLKRLVDPIERVEYLYGKVEEYNNEVFADPVVSQFIQCKKGCSMCCHTQVSVSNDEAVLLADLIKNGQKIDWQRLHKQKEAGNSNSKYYQLSYQDRACVFLDDEGACSIYENRPMVCRTNNVVSDPKNCDTRVVEKPTISLINTYKSDIVVYAGFEKASGGVMASVLWESLEQIDEIPVLLRRTAQL